MSASRGSGMGWRAATKVTGATPMPRVSARSSRARTMSNEPRARSHEFSLELATTGSGLDSVRMQSRGRRDLGRGKPPGLAGASGDRRPQARVELLDVVGAADDT